MHILSIMNKTISAPANEPVKYAPRILTHEIDPEKIGALIGPGGKEHQGNLREVPSGDQHRE
jgi:polyribonucleotide nucleotidyltransferase